MLVILWLCVLLPATVSVYVLEVCKEVQFSVSSEYMRCQEIRIGSLNVRGLRTDVKKESLANDLEKYKLSFLAIQETHIKETDYLDLNGKYKLFVHGDENSSHAGVGFAYSSDFPCTFDIINTRIVALKTTVDKKKFTILNGYAPTLITSEKDPKVRENFYDDLDNYINTVPKSHVLIICGDFNAKIGTLHSKLPNHIGKYGKDNMEGNHLPLDQILINSAAHSANHKFNDSQPTGIGATRQFISYVAPLQHNNPTDIEEWLQRTTYIEQDLTWLLHLSHQEFWCQVVFEKSVHKCLTSYLQNARRYYDPPSQSLTNQNVSSLEESIHKKVFMTYLRLATHKESADTYITPAVFGEIIYEKFIFDIPKLMDICVLYGKGNQELLCKMIANIFTQQPKYLDDLRMAVPTLIQVLDNIQQKVFALNPTVTDQVDKFDQGCSLSLTDLVMYAVDSSATLFWLTELFPPAAESFWNLLPLKIANFVENTLTTLLNECKKYESKDPGLVTELRKQLSFSRLSFIKLFRNIVSISCLNPILENRSQVSVALAEEFLQVISECLSEHSFITDYESLYPFNEDLELLKQSGCFLGSVQVEYIQSALHGTHDIEDEEDSQIEEETDPNYTLTVEDVLLDSELGATASAVPSALELDSLVTHIKEILPDLGDGFIVNCLEYYNFEVEDVLNNLLCDSLPEDLQTLDRQMKRKPKKVEKSTILASRANVFDGDAFDVFTQDQIDTSRVILQKKEKVSEEILEDKSEIDKLKSFIYERYSSVNDEAYETGLYDDEYDDTYDESQIGADDADSADELLSKFGFFAKPKNFGKASESDISTDYDDRDDDEEPDDKNEKRSKDQFIEDPAVLRERAAARRASQQGRKTNQSRPPKDIAGKPKGQGQDSKVLQARRAKEKHKGSRANHNRKALADRKMAKGMF